MHSVAADTDAGHSIALGECTHLGWEGILGVTFMKLWLMGLSLQEIVGHFVASLTHDEVSAD